MTIVIHHNSDCDTSRNTLEMICASGEETNGCQTSALGQQSPFLAPFMNVCKEVYSGRKTSNENTGTIIYH